MRRLMILVAAALLVCAPRIAVAEDTLLTVKLPAQADITFTRSDLEAMPVREFSTTTLWTEGEVRFIGVSLSTLLSRLGVVEGVIKAQAINDYAVEVPVADATEDGPIIAYLMNGEEMSRRDKGPLWIVYPYDANVAYQTETYYSRSIWQLDRVTILK